MLSINKNKRVLIPLSFIVLSVLYVALFIKSGQLFVTDDRTFHIERFEEAFLSLKHGYWYPYISTFSFLRIGQAINSFYPPFITTIYAVIRLLVKSPILTIYILIALEQFAGLAVAYYSGRKILDSWKRAYLFAILLRFSSYIVYNDFSRFDVGESWGLVFLPLSFCGLFIIIAKNSYKKGCLMLAIGLTLQTYNHILMPLMTVGVLLMFYLVTLSVQRNHYKIMKSLVISAFIYFCNCLVVFIPAIYMSKGGVVRPNLNALREYTFSFSDFISNSLSNTINRGNYGIGVFLVVSLIIGIIPFLKDNTMNYYTRIFFAFSWLFAFASTNIFPWKLLADTPLAIIQFPWRLLNFSILFIALYSANALTSIRIDFRYLIGMVTLLLVLTVGSQSQFQIAETKEFHIASSKNDFHNPWPTFINSENYDKVTRINREYAGFQDYVPKKSENYLGSIFKHNVFINGKTTHSVQIKSGFQSLEFHIRGYIEKGSTVQLPFLIYRENDYILTINNHKIPVFKKSDRGCLEFKAPRNLSNIKVKVGFNVPKAFIISRWISLLTTAITIILILRISYKQKHNREGV